MSIFNYDGPLMTFLSKVADLMILNFLTLLCCIPIVTAGAAITALNYMTLKIVRGEEGYVFRGYFKAFKSNFKQATILWLIILGAVLIIVGDAYIILNSGLNFHFIILGLVGLATLIAVLTIVFILPLQAKFENSVKNTLKNAFALGMVQLPRALIMFVFTLLPGVLFFFFEAVMPFLFLFGLSVPALLSAKVYNKCFLKLEERIMEAQPREEGEDERIFKDELDESLLDDKTMH